MQTGSININRQEIQAANLYNKDENKEVRQMSSTHLKDIKDQYDLLVLKNDNLLKCRIRSYLLLEI